MQGLISRTMVVKVEYTSVRNLYLPKVEGHNKKKSNWNRSYILYGNRVPLIKVITLIIQDIEGYISMKLYLPELAVSGAWARSSREFRASINR